MAAFVSARAGALATSVAVRERGCCTISPSASCNRRPTRLRSGSCAIRLRSGSRRAGLSLGGGHRSRGISSASRDDIPSEILDEDSKFVPIHDEDPRFGPPAILLLGFTNEEAGKVKDLLKEMEGDFMQVLLCTEEMAKGTLGKAMDAVQPNLMEVQVATGLPRISFLSGLTGEEIMMLIQIFPESGLERTVFAAHVSLNSDKLMAELLEEILDDHRRLSKQAEAVEQTES